MSSEEDSCVVRTECMHVVLKNITKTEYDY